MHRRNARGHRRERLEHVSRVRREQRVRHLRRPHPQRRGRQRPGPRRRGFSVGFDNHEHSLEHQMERLAIAVVRERRRRTGARRRLGRLARVKLRFEQSPEALIRRPEKGNQAVFRGQGYVLSECPARAHAKRRGGARVQRLERRAEHRGGRRGGRTGRQPRRDPQRPSPQKRRNRIFTPGRQVAIKHQTEEPRRAERRVPATLR